MNTENGNEKIMALLQVTVKNINETEHIYKAKLYSKNVTHPIPFFGDIEKAKVITVGINPVSSEFSANRAWPQNIDLRYLYERLKNYFNYPGVPPHNWFSVWEEALNHISISYHSGDAAHIDISSRSTKNIKQISKQISEVDLFEKMLAEDINMFFQFISNCEYLKLLLISGTVSKRKYINEFIKKQCPRYGFKLEGNFIREENLGNGKTYFHRLIGNNIDIPVFFCSVSPSADNPSLLIERIIENKSRLIELIERDDKK